MTVITNPDAYRASVLGNGPVSKASGTLSGTTFDLFLVTGGEVLITSFYLKATTAISTDGGTLALETVPTTGDTIVHVTATDLGTTDTAIGTVVGVDSVGTTVTAPKFLRGGRGDLNAVVPTGTVKLLGAASVNGAVTAYCTWIPLTQGARLAAA